MDFIRLQESMTLDAGENHEEIRDRILRVAESKNYKVIPAIEAIHATMTKNNVNYPATKLRGQADFKTTGPNARLRPSGVHSWTTPYNKPILINHDITTDPLGRITRAEFKQRTSTGMPGIICYPEIFDFGAIERVLDGRYSTVSIGADTDSAICSICKQDQMNGWCEHDKGKIYDGKLAFWTTGNLWFIELSYVNAPADEHAGTIEVPDGVDNGDSTSVKVTTKKVGNSHESVESSIETAFLLQDLKANRIYDLSHDRVFVPTSSGLYQIPQKEFIKEYFYIPFNVKVEESAETPAAPQEAKAADNPESPKGKNVKPLGKMKTDTQKQAYYANSLLNGYYSKENTNWTKDEIIKEHNRVVKAILDHGWKHTMNGALDDTLPEDLKNRSESAGTKSK